LLVILGQFVSHFGISEYQQCICDVSTMYQYSRTFAFLIRLYQIRIRNVYHMCISSVSVTCRARIAVLQADAPRSAPSPCWLPCANTSATSITNTKLASITHTSTTHASNTHHAQSRARLISPWHASLHPGVGRSCVQLPATSDSCVRCIGLQYSVCALSVRAAAYCTCECPL
jgi:hypothetical protein